MKGKRQREGQKEKYDQWGSPWGVSKLAGSKVGDMALPYLNLNLKINIQ
jgi:hypothetical protein